MYVSRENSGQGIGSKLVSAEIDRAKALSNMEQINLPVIASNTGARRLYGKFGFEPFSLKKNAVKYKGVYFDEEIDGAFYMSCLKPSC